MSAESQAIFDKSLLDYQAGECDADTLRAAAIGHLGASRTLEDLGALYAAVLATGDHDEAQILACEMVPVRAAERVAAGILPRMDN